MIGTQQINGTVGTVLENLIHCLNYSRLLICIEEGESVDCLRIVHS